MEEEFLGRLQSLGKPKKKKRGGLAGLWDRNKNIIAPIVSGGLGLINPALGIAAGAAMRGIDRPGKGGIGFDVKEGVRGGIEGAATGGLARGLSSVVQGARMGAAGAQALGMSGTKGALRGAGLAARDTVMGAGGTMSPDTAGTTAGKAGMTAQAPARGLNRALQFVEKNPTAVGMGLQALSGVMSAQEERRIEEARLEEERRRSRNLGMLAAPIFRETFGGSR